MEGALLQRRDCRRGSTAAEEALLRKRSFATGEPAKDAGPAAAPAVASRHRQRQTDTDTERQTDNQTQTTKHTHRQINASSSSF